MPVVRSRTAEARGRGASMNHADAGTGSDMLLLQGAAAAPTRQ
jgi:hypothetical protein